ncbi:hypothetical protein HOG48_03895 [Candidatus Peregrinibacteria bacterium]|nr:hypothetical protein [Candidatus Peregrinibacteria bacterium]
MPEKFSHPDLVIETIEPPRQITAQRAVVSVAILEGRRIFAVVENTSHEEPLFWVYGRGKSDDVIPEDLRPERHVKNMSSDPGNWQWYRELDGPDPDFQRKGAHHFGSAHGAIRESVRALFKRMER